MILDEFVSLLGTFIGNGFAEYFLFPILCLAFVASVPCIVRHFIRS